MRRIALICALAASLSTAACAQRLDPTTKYAVSGATAGAVAGASIGIGLGDPFLGTALIGGLLGGAAGYVYGEYWAEAEPDGNGEPTVLF